MMSIETSNRDAKFRSFAPFELGSTYQMSAWVLSVLDSRVKQTLASPLNPFTFDVRQDISKTSIGQENSGMVLSDQSETGWVAHIREEFYSFPEVESIYMTIDDSDIDIWLLVRNRSIGLVRQLAEKEMEILDRFASAERPLFLIDFHVVYRCGADESQFVPQRAIRLPR